MATWRRRWHSTPVLPGESHGQRSLVGCSSWGRTELDTKWLSNSSTMWEVTERRETWSRGESTIRVSVRGQEQGPAGHRWVCALSARMGTTQLSQPSRSAMWSARQGPPDHTQSGRLRGWRNLCLNLRKGDTDKLFHVLVYATSGHILITNFPLTEKKRSRKYAFI